MRGVAVASMAQRSHMSRILSKQDADQFRSIRTKNIPKKRSEDSKFNSVHDVWANQAKAREASLTLVCLIYLFNQDDGVIDKKEERIIDKTIKKAQEYITYEEYVAVSELTDRSIDHIFVKDYIQQYQYNSITINKVLSTLFEQVKGEVKYENLLRLIQEKT